jgi:hypothetical protein
MAKALQPAVTASGISFELDRFEFGGGDRLELSGRWFGVRGRRFMRPTLAHALEGERRRALADLEHKPWAAEDGEPWHASFPWPEGAEVLETELSVAPDITVRLPPPSADLEPAQRYTALPREDFMAIGTIAEPRPEEADEPIDQPAETKPTADERSPPERRVEAELEAVRAELAAVRAELAAAHVELNSAMAQRDTAVQEAARAVAQRDEAIADRDQAIADRDKRAAQDGDAGATRDRAMAERDEAIADQRQAVLERDRDKRALAANESALAAAQAALDRATRERDEAITVHGAALVMRNATRALPAYRRHVGWFRRGLLIALLLAAAIALLTVLHVF